MSIVGVKYFLNYVSFGPVCALLWERERELRWSNKIKVNEKSGSGVNEKADESEK